MSPSRCVLIAITTVLIITTRVHAQCDPAHMWRLEISDRDQNDFGNRWHGGIDLSARWLAIGDVNYGVRTGWQGAALVYSFGDTGLQQHRVLYGPPNVNGDFATSIAVRDDGWLFVGAPREQDRGYYDVGVVYIYQYVHDRWAHVDRLSDASTTYANFGRQVVTDGRWLAVSAPREGGYNAYCGAVYVYELRDAEWHFHSRLAAPDEQILRYFGHSLALKNDLLAVGTDAANRAYIFRLKQGEWVCEATLLSPSGRPSLAFGSSVAIAGGDVGVGDASGGLDENGTLYIFRDSQHGWSEHTKLKPDVNEQYTCFAKQLSGDGSRFVISSNETVYNPQDGAIYVYEQHNDEWTRTAKLATRDRMQDRELGTDLTLFGNAVASTFVDQFAPIRSDRLVDLFDLDACGLSLQLVGDCPGQLIGHVGNARPGQRVVFIAGRFETTRPLPGCRGLPIGLGQPEIIGSVIADRSGVAALPFDIANDTHCGRLLVQAIDPDHCRFSNIVRTPD